MRLLCLMLAATWLAVSIATPALAADAKEKKKIVFIAGKASHGFGAHDHKAGSHLLADALNKSGLPIEAVVVENGWPKDEAVLEGAAAIIIYADGGGGHPALKHLDKLSKLMDQGVGLGCIHYGVEPADKAGRAEFAKWIGGYFETFYSVNPWWTAKYKDLPKHAVTQGVKPFSTNDEWYYNMRFRENMEGVTPILVDIPPEKTRGAENANSPHGGNPAVRARKGMPETTTWVATRQPNEQRGFGTTGGHVHWNWGQDDWRKLVLNACAWIAKVEVPEGGVPNQRPSVEEMLTNHDEPVPENFNKRAMQERIEKMNGPMEAAAR